MWTYLIIFFSIALLVGIFIRRVILFLKENKKKKKVVFSKKEMNDLSGTNSKKLSKEEKSKISALFGKGEAKLKAGKEDEAIKYFVQALAIDELHVETQHKLAMLYMQKQMYSAASALFKNLGKLTGEAVHYSHLGLALYQQGLFEEAKEAYQNAVKIDPSRTQRFASLAHVYRSLGQLQNAVIAMNKAYEADKENLDYLFFLVDIQTEMQNFAEAKEIINRILELEPENEEAIKYLDVLKKLESEKQSSESEAGETKK